MKTLVSFMSMNPPIS